MQLGQLACSVTLPTGSTWASYTIVPKTNLLLVRDTIYTSLLMRMIQPNGRVANMPQSKTHFIRKSIAFVMYRN